MSKRNRVVIVGGGTGGITVAAQLRNQLKTSAITVLEPSETHYYQPLWTLVGGGECKIGDTARPEKALIPKNVTWVRDSARTFLPEQNTVVTNTGQKFEYDALVVAPGLQIDWEKIPGLTAALEHDPRVSTNYDPRYAPKTWDAIRTFKGGSALFTSPSTPIKCGGAPQKIMYLADDAFRRQGVRQKSQVHAYFAGTTIFGVPEYAKTLNEVVKRKNVDVHLRYELIEVRHTQSEAVFFHLDQKREEVVHYDMMHVTPPMSAPDFIKESPFAVQQGASKGWMAVDSKTLQSPTYPNVFGVGDVAAVPTSKTGAAVRKQAPVLVKHLKAFLEGAHSNAEYDGYTSCPLSRATGSWSWLNSDTTTKSCLRFPSIKQRSDGACTSLRNTFFRGCTGT